MKTKIFIVHPFGLEDGVIEEEGVLCQDGRMLVEKNQRLYKKRQWFSTYSLTREDAVKKAEGIRKERMAKLKSEYIKLSNLKFA